MSANRFFRIAAFCCFAAVAALPAFAGGAKDSGPPEAELMAAGKIAEAVKLLETEHAADQAAQKRAAEIYLSLALYDKALERFKAGGMDSGAAAEACVSAALQQKHYASALRLARAANTEAAVAGKLAAAELEAGRAGAALDLARKAGGAELIKRAGEAAFTETMESGIIRRPIGIGRYDSLTFSPDGRYLILFVWTATKREFEIIDLRAPKTAEGEAKGRRIAPDFHVDNWTVDKDGRFLAIFGRMPDPKSEQTRNRPEVAVLRVERLDTGKEIGRWLLDLNTWSSNSEPVFAGDLISLTYKDATGFFEILSGALAAKAEKGKPLPYPLDPSRSSVSSNWVKGLEKAWLIGAGNGGNLYIAQSKLGRFALAVVGGKGEIISQYDQRDVTSGAADAFDFSYQPGVLSADKRYLAAAGKTRVSLFPFPFQDRYAAAYELAKEFGLEDRFAAAGETLLAGGNFDGALAVMSRSGKSEKEVYKLFGDYCVAKNDTKQATEWYLKAGDPSMLIAQANEIIAKAKSYDLDSAYYKAEALYAKGGVPTSTLRIVVGRRLESEKKYVQAREYYSIAGAKEELARIAFFSEAIGSAEINNSNGLAEWCLQTAAKAGIPDAEAKAKVASLYEERGHWEKANEYYGKVGDKAGVRRVVLAAAKDKRERDAARMANESGDPAIIRALSDTLIEIGDLWNAHELAKDTKDGATLARLADKAYDRADIFQAAGWYLEAKELGSPVSAVKSKDALRISLVSSDLGTLIRTTKMAEDTIGRIKAGKLALVWPIPPAKLSDHDYAQIAPFGKRLSELESKPTSKEARRCAEYLGQSSKKELASGNHAQANFDADRMTWYLFSAKFLQAMGR